MNSTAYSRMTNLEKRHLLATAQRPHIKKVDRHCPKTGDFYHAYQATIRGVIVIHNQKSEWLSRQDALTAGRTVLKKLKVKTSPQ